MISDWQETTEAGITAPEGFRGAAGRCGLKAEGDDMAIMVADSPCSVAGVFTTNVVKASCVRRNRRIVWAGTAQAIVCNAGNANCCNGERGNQDNRAMAEHAARQLDIAPDHVLTASTGIIGKPLPLAPIRHAIESLRGDLRRGSEVDLEIARAIMTTDTRPKQLALDCDSPDWRTRDGRLRFGGVAKGSGMIAPRLGPPHATMFCFLTTDARIPPKLLQQSLEWATQRTFNRMTIDGDTSTNDMVLCLASGAGAFQVSDESSTEFKDFSIALEGACRRLAWEIARDGEGATKVVEVVVLGAKTESDAERIGRSIAESPLVKTALFGKDPNWGRILMAAGKAGVPFDQNTVEVSLGRILVYDNGAGVDFDPDAASEYLGQPEVRITIDLRAGHREAMFYTCDYSHGYITINADYHT